VVTMRKGLDFGTKCPLGSSQRHTWHLVPLLLEVRMPEHEAETEVLTSDELLVEEVSIDGMCGVY
jgi:mycofactocin precursor